LVRNSRFTTAFFTCDLTSIVASAYLRKSTDGVYKLDDWLELRQNYGAYYIFYTKFVRAIVGKRPFRSRLRSMAKGDETASVSDEALTLLGFENSIEMWDNVWKISKGEIHTVRHDERIPKNFKSKLLPVYTRTSRSDPANQRNTEDKRWSSEGIIRFNKLRLLVIQDREDHPDFKITWLNQVREEMKGTLDNDVEDLKESGNVDVFRDSCRTSRFEPSEANTGSP
jgi:hypothetical protein